MPVYIIPYDQAPCRRSLEAHVLEHTYRLVDTDFPALPSRKKPTTLCRFLYLPKELRESIWDYAVRDEPYVASGSIKRRFTHPIELRKHITTDSSICPFLPAICRLSRQTREETIHVYLRSSTIMVASYKDNLYLTAFLQAYNGYCSIRGLHFENFDWFNSGRYEVSTTNSDLELSVLCTGLRHIKLRMHNRRLHQEILTSPYDDDEYVPVPVQDLWDFYMLDRLVACEALIKVTILRKGWTSDAGNQTAAALVARIEDAFRAVGRLVAVEAIHE